MSRTATSRRRQGPGRLDPTVRGLLRAFLSPAVADRYASALQPIAVADRDAALAGAVSTLRARFFVLPEEIAVVLVEDAGWPVAEVSTMLGLPAPAVRAALRTSATDEPRIGASPPDDVDDVDDEAAAVDAMLADLPTRRRDAARAAVDDPEGEAVDVELSTALPRSMGRSELEAQFARSDRLQRLVVNGTIAGVLLVAGLVLATTSATPTAGPDEDVVAVTPTPPPAATPGPDDAGTPSADPTPTPSPDPTATPSPDGEATPSPDATATPEPDDVPVGDPTLAEARFVASVDPATGEPGATLDPATTDDDPRLWLRFSQLPAEDPIVLLTFTAPSGRSTVRPVLLSDRTPLAAVRLPDELGRQPGRYAVRIEAPGLDPVVRDLELVEGDGAA